MSRPQAVFQRCEKKYMLDQKTFQLVQNALDGHMKLDEYGLSTICSVYFDSDNLDLIRRSVDKPVYKEKLRLRCYGTEVSDDDKVFIEIKRKYNGVVYKRRICLPYKQAREYLFEKKPCPIDSQIAKEIDWFIDFYKLMPAAFVCYDRLAYYGTDDSDLRITFDMNVRCRSDRLSLHEGDDGERIIPQGSAIMEIKTLSAIPIWLCSLLSENKIYPTSFSKYGTYYTMTHSEPGSSRSEETAMIAGRK